MKCASCRIAKGSTNVSKCHQYIGTRSRHVDCRLGLCLCFELEGRDGIPSTCRHSGLPTPYTTTNIPTYSLHQLKSSAHGIVSFSQSVYSSRGAFRRSGCMNRCGIDSFWGFNGCFPSQQHGRGYCTVRSCDSVVRAVSRWAKRSPFLRGSELWQLVLGMLSATWPSIA